MLKTEINVLNIKKRFEINILAFPFPKEDDSVEQRAKLYDVCVDKTLTPGYGVKSTTINIINLQEDGVIYSHNPVSSVGRTLDFYPIVLA